VDDLQAVLHALDSMKIEHTAPVANTFSLLGTAPLEITFVATHNPAYSQPENRYSRISWIVLTANDSTQRLMRRVFAALRLKQFHEGCCDYWTLGPVDSRTAIRFELPPGSSWASPPPKVHPEPWWLSIEEGGVVYAY
jgi:hypothetical protein